jgi:hypothetical protein
MPSFLKVAHRRIGTKTVNVYRSDSKEGEDISHVDVITSSRFRDFSLRIRRMQRRRVRPVFPKRLSHYRRLSTEKGFVWGKYHGDQRITSP